MARTVRVALRKHPEFAETCFLAATLNIHGPSTERDLCFSDEFDVALFFSFIDGLQTKMISRRVGNVWRINAFVRRIPYVFAVPVDG